MIIYWGDNLWNIVRSPGNRQVSGATTRVFNQLGIEPSPDVHVSPPVGPERMSNVPAAADVPAPVRSTMRQHGAIASSTPEVELRPLPSGLPGAQTRAAGPVRTGEGSVPRYCPFYKVNELPEEEPLQQCPHRCWFGAWSQEGCVQRCYRGLHHDGRCDCGTHGQGSRVSELWCVPASVMTYQHWHRFPYYR